MSNAIEKVKQILDQLPEDSSYEDIQYHIYIREKVEKGLKDIDAGRITSQEDVEKRMAKWTRE